MSAPLQPLDDVLQPILQQLRPVLPSRVPLDEAGGAVTAEPLRASRAIPERALALRSGLAVASLDLVGASPQSPIVLGGRPYAVIAGDTLPKGCDAVIDRSAVTEVGVMLIVSEAAAPGMNARLEGQDLAPGAILLSAGQRMTPEAMLACRLAGIDAIAVRQPRVSVQLEEASHAAWLEQRLSALGCKTSVDGSQNDLVIRDATQTAPRLALQPGEMAWIELEPDSAVLIELPARFDGVVAGYAAFVLPVVAQLVGLGLQASPNPLTRKISSSIGMTELALLRTAPAGYQPLAVGDVTLSAVAQADSCLLIPPNAEGYAAGDIVLAIRLADPFGHEHLEGVA